MKRCTISCPKCQTAIELKVFFYRFGVFRCHRCDALGFGPVHLRQKDEELGDHDIVVRLRDEDEHNGK